MALVYVFDVAMDAATHTNLELNDDGQHKVNLPF